MTTQKSVPPAAPQPAAECKDPACPQVMFRHSHGAAPQPATDEEVARLTLLGMGYHFDRSLGEWVKSDGAAPQTPAEPVAEVTYSVTDGLTVRWLRIPKPGDKLYASPHQAASPAPAAEHMADLLRRAEDYLDTGDDERAGHIIADLVAALLAAHSVDGPLPPQRVAE